MLVAGPACMSQRAASSSGAPAASSSAKDAPAAAGGAPTRRAPALAELPRGLHELGDECGYPVAPHVYCGDAGVIVGVYAAVDEVHGVPPREATTVRDEPRMELAPGRSLTIAHEGERLWVQRVTCGACRRVMGWAFVGDLPGMKPEQLRDLQTRLDIGADAPLLETIADWRIYYKDRPLPDPVEPR